MPSKSPQLFMSVQFLSIHLSVNIIREVLLGPRSFSLMYGRMKMRGNAMSLVNLQVSHVMFNYKFLPDNMLGQVGD